MLSSLGFYWSFVRETTGHQWIPLTKANGTERWRFLWYKPAQTVKQTIETPVICTPSRSLWRHCNGAANKHHINQNRPCYMTSFYVPRPHQVYQRNTTYPKRYSVWNDCKWRKILRITSGNQSYKWKQYTVQNVKNNWFEIFLSMNL